MQLDQLYRETVSRLHQGGIANARNEALLLFSALLQVELGFLVLHPEQTVSPEKVSLLEKALARRLTGEPLQYITGTREFWSLDFEVTPSVLVPRPETEFLLDRVLAVLAGSELGKGPLLDMCTGSGVIAVVLALELKAPSVIAVDSSPEALEVAARNVEKHGCAQTVQLLCSDLFGAIRPDAGFSCIVANPPYIAEAELASLQPEVRDWEPVSALLAGKEGLDIIERLSGQGQAYLMSGGWLFLEIGAEQENAVLDLFGSLHAYEEVVVHKDWSGRPRVLQARKRG